LAAFALLAVADGAAFLEEGWAVVGLGLGCGGEQQGEEGGAGDRAWVHGGSQARQGSRSQSRAGERGRGEGLG